MFDNGFRLNVGSAEAYALSPGDVRLLLLLTDSAPPTLTGVSLSPSPYKSTPPGTQLFLASPTQVAALEAWSQQGLIAFVRLACVNKHGKPRNTPYHPSHSPGLVSYLSSAVGQDIPTPRIRAGS